MTNPLFILEDAIAIKSKYFKPIRPASGDWNRQFVKWLCKRYLTKFGNVADLGCGEYTENSVSYFLLGRGYRVTALDYPEIDLNKHLNLESDKYDYVILKFVLEHLTDADMAIQECHRILKTGGKLIILTDKPNKYFHDDPTHKIPYTIAQLEGYTLLNDFKTITLRDWRNIPFIWKWAIKAFDYSFPNSKQIIGVFEK